MNESEYVNPLSERYASPEMLALFSPRCKFGAWRRLWIALAECERDLGLPITGAQIDEMRANADNIDFEAAAAFEKETRHDVMAHIKAFGAVCPSAMPIIHLGATSAFVGDNTDLLQMREGARILLGRLVGLISALKKFAADHADMATLGFTHFQAAQLTTVGKRACLWIYDLIMDFEELARFESTLKFRGVKGTTGTQASFLNLFNGDHEKVKALDKAVAKKMGFDEVFPVTGQTYTRKVDAQIASILSGLGQSLHKIANDIRLLQHLKEVEEPFEKGQVGSSAMAYKRNPMRSERITALCRFLMSSALSPAMTAAEQWFERTLDDSANKRISIPQAFLAADAALIIAANVCSGLVIYPQVIAKHIAVELPFMATENIIMEAVKKGGDRQQLHEHIRVHSMEAGQRVKVDGEANDLMERIAADPVFGMSAEDLAAIMDVRQFVGRAPEQVGEFVRDYVDPVIGLGASYKDMGPQELRV
ncbi:MAG: adenylosuccinate lyase [Chitinispirillia bacterium]|nr:adenylosuccinate lyase [Chitinispirillia bacterium]MCL2241241.1 adenylosuccinate lyase [Chitinispirillia bacterium]